YSYSKHFGCTGWRLGVAAVHRDNVFDDALLRLGDADREDLRVRYRSLSTAPDRMRFIDRMVADSRDVALNHTARLPLPQQAQLPVLSVFALLDRDDTYERRCREILRGRLERLAAGLDVELPTDPLRVGYYVDLDLDAWGRHVIGRDFADYVEAHHEPL